MTSVDQADARHHYIVLNDGVDQYAYCSCGWTSPPSVTAGIAGALWDMHVATEHDESLLARGGTWG